MDENEKQQITLELKMLIRMVWKTTTMAYEQWLLREGIDVSGLQSAVLRLLTHDDLATISELSKHFGIDPSTLVPTVDALQRKGYLIRQRDPNDRRRVLLTLTDAGDQLAKRLPHLIEDDPLLAGIDGLGEEKATQLVALLSELVTAMPDGIQLLHNALPRLLATGIQEDKLRCKQFLKRP